MKLLTLAEVTKTYRADTKEHTMRIELDEGVHRSIYFGRQHAYWFRIITWPRGLCIHGDMGSYVFSRIEDMFDFKWNDPEYLNGKLQHGAQFADDVTTRYSIDVVKAWVKSELGEGSYPDEDLSDFLSEVCWNEYDEWQTCNLWAKTFSNPHEMPSFRDWDYRYLWCIAAIDDSIKKYYESKQATNKS